ncbi:MAG TPA: hypothetical protein VMZ53_28920 [Kofleriaceae bacterium]|nr:hypothetical protein [Kofleriaceae bacterium]
MEKPDHLRPVRTPRAAAVIALALGVVAFAVCAISQQDIWATPDWRVSVPGLAVTSIAAIASVARREKSHALWIVGVALAAAATVLGWFLMVAIVIAVAAVLILILHSVM